MNYLNEAELNMVKGLLHYLNDSFGGNSLAADVEFTDSNGDILGRVEYVSEAEEYVFKPGTCR